jgi:hypothetical protein
MAITIANRPAGFDGCWGSWDEQQEPNVIRTDMEMPGYTKVRRRTTGISRKANVGRVFEEKYYDAFVMWFNVSCQGGVLPTRMTTPQGKQEVWRFTEPPKISWVSPKAFQVSVAIEQLPAYRGL